MKTSGLKVDQDADTLAFAAFRSGMDRASSASRRASSTPAAMMAKFAKDKTKPVVLRNNQHLSAGLWRHERLLPEPDDDGVR